MKYIVVIFSFAIFASVSYFLLRQKQVETTVTSNQNIDLQESTLSTTTNEKSLILGEPTKTFASKELGITFQYYEEQGEPIMKETIEPCWTKDFITSEQSYFDDDYYERQKERIDMINGEKCIMYQVDFIKNKKRTLALLAMNEFMVTQESLPPVDKGSAPLVLPPKEFVKKDNCPLPHYESGGGSCWYFFQDSVLIQGEKLEDSETLGMGEVPYYGYGFFISKTNIGVLMMLNEYSRISTDAAKLLKKDGITDHVFGDSESPRQRAMLDKVVETIEFIQ